MSFEIKVVEGTVDQIEVDLSEPSHHEREEFVVDEIKKAINHVVTALGGYLSVSCNGNINPVSGETGDVVNIYITSLPATTVVTPPAGTSPVEEAQTGEPTLVTEETGQPQPIASPENQEPVQQESVPSGPPVETPPVIQENTPPPTWVEIPPTEPENPAEIASGVSPEPNTTSVGQAEAQEIAQATPPVEPAA